MSFPGCVPSSPAVTFSYSDWVARYPEFTQVSQQSAQLYFNEATLYCANKLGPVENTTILATLLNMLTAHIAALNSPVTSSGASPTTPPGRISNVSEGSVSAAFSVDTANAPGSKDWYAQTKYGFAYWQATLNYRLFRYKVTPVFDPRAFPAMAGTVPWLFPNVP